MQITSPTVRSNLHAKGFSLIELVVALAIIATLATIALPSYETQLQQTRRSDGTMALIAFAQKMERYLLEQGSYSGATTAIYQSSSNRGYYQLAVTTDNSSYQLTATPTGAQAEDSTCGILTLNEQGARSISGTGAVEECW